MVPALAALKLLLLYQGGHWGKKTDIAETYAAVMMQVLQ